MPLQEIQLPIRSNRTANGYEGDAGLVNAYVEELGQDAKRPFAAYAMPGLTSQVTLTNGGGIKDMIAVGSKLYVHADKFVYSLNNTFNASLIGGIPTVGSSTMKQNRREPPQIGIVSDGLYYVIDTNADDMTIIGDPDYKPSSSLAFIDGYFVLPVVGDDRWGHTAVDDATSIDPLDFASAESSPDAITKPVEFNRELWFFGGLGEVASTEVWQPSTTGTFSFVRSSSFALGCLAQDSVAEIDEKLIWVAHDGTVRMTDGGYGGIQISNHGVERAIAAETNKSRMIATTWSMEGHHFYNLSGSTFSYQFDTKTGSWSERKSYGLNRWRVNKVVEFNGQLVAGDYANGKIYGQVPLDGSRVMSKDTFDEDGSPLIMETILPPVHAWPNGLIFDAMYIDVVPGVGRNTTDDHSRDPRLMLDWSQDGGRSFSTQRTYKLGVDGATNQSIKATRLGSLRENQRTFRLSISADCKRGILGAAVDAEALAP